MKGDCRFKAPSDIRATATTKGYITKPKFTGYGYMSSSILNLMVWLTDAICLLLMALKVTSIISTSMRPWVQITIQSHTSYLLLALNSFSGKVNSWSTRMMVLTRLCLIYVGVYITVSVVGNLGLWIKYIYTDSNYAIPFTFTLLIIRHFQIIKQWETMYQLPHMGWIFLEPDTKLEQKRSGVHREMLPITWLWLIRISNSSGYQTSLEFGGAYLTFLLNHINTIPFSFSLGIRWRVICKTNEDFII